jgi:hypothetical protein
MPKKKSAKPAAKGATGRKGVRAAGDSPIRTVFYGSGAYVATLLGERKVEIWVKDPVIGKYSTSQEFPIDLDKCPSKLSTADRALVQIDDGVYAPSEKGDGSTTIGPTYPSQREGAYVGAAYIADIYRDQIQAKGIEIPCPPPGYEDSYDFEFQVAWYWPGTGDPRGGKRYFGHYAEVIKTEGRLALCAIRVAGSLKTSVNVWVDLSSPDDCDAGPGSLTHLSLEGNVASGSLFLGQTIYDPTAPLVGPKIPKSFGT